MRKKITDWTEYDFETRAVRAGYDRTGENEHSEAIFTTSSYIFDDAETASRKFSNKDAGNVYSRFTNPTVRAFEQRLASLDQAESCIATGSGMSAIMLMTMGLLSQGDHVLCSRSVFGSISIFFSQIMSRFGITTDFVDQTSVDAWADAVKPNTKLFFAESPSNPIQDLVDIPKVAQVAHDNGALLVIDNAFATPALQNPLSLGADLTIYTATKFIDGQGRCVGGAVVGSQELVGEKLFSLMRTIGPSLSPFNAWVFLKGLETLNLRMEAISARAQHLALWLENHPKVVKVHYTWLESHAQHALAQKQQKAGGGIIAFEIKSAIKDLTQNAFNFVDATSLMSLSGNLGDVKTIITHPATTTHGRLNAEERLRANVKDNLIRISVGLESIDNLKTDLEKGFAAI